MKKKEVGSRNKKMKDNDDHRYLLTSSIKDDIRLLSQSKRESSYSSIKNMKNRPNNMKDLINRLKKVTDNKKKSHLDNITDRLNHIPLDKYRIPIKPSNTDRISTKDILYNTILSKKRSTTTNIPMSDSMPNILYNSVHTDTIDLDTIRDKDIADMKHTIDNLYDQLYINKTNAHNIDHGKNNDDDDLKPSVSRYDRKDCNILNILSTSSIDTIKSMIHNSTSDQIVEIIINIRNEYNSL